MRDLVWQRAGELPRVPDAVVRPGSEDEVAAILEAAMRFDAVVIAFGGGSSISGSLEAPAVETRPVISVDLERLNKVLEIDADSRLARVQAGVFGPDLEQQLAARGYTFGHFPDSFTHSTLGGWIATRSSGMQSDRYGDIADMTKGLRVVTPSGTLVTRPIPATSTGPSVREMVLGSEGRLGIITEATVHVRRIPEKRVILGYLFPTFSAALAAMQELAASEYSVSVTRVSDANETQFSFAMRVMPTVTDKLQSRALEGVPQPKARVGSERDVPVVHRLRGQRAARGGAAADRRQARQAPRRPVHRLGPGGAVRPEEVRHPVHPGLPARPRRRRGRVRDRDHVEQSEAALRSGDQGRERRVRPR